MTSRDTLPELLDRMTGDQQDRFWRENPHLRHLRPHGPEATRHAMGVPKRLELAGMAGSKRLRQSVKPLLNRLETAFWAWMKVQRPELTLRPQAKRYELARGIWYKPDFTAMDDARETAWECKGPRAFRGGFENLKVAARVWPEVTWILVWQDGGQWKAQEILS